MMIAIFSIPIFLYIVFIGYLAYSFNRKSTRIDSKEFGISIIIPCRNEANQILNCLEAIKKQSYSAEHFEVIVVDDHSEDNTFEIAQSFIGIKQIKVIYALDIGKKAALNQGIEIAKYQVVLTVDADCTFVTEWLHNMANCFASHNLSFLCGPVSIRSGNSLFGLLQQAESAAIVGMSAVTLNAGWPTTCNGANLMFKKSVFENLGGYFETSHISSGDDDLLMHKFFKLNPKSCRYLTDKNSMVYTKSAGSFFSFIDQRIRWLSKKDYYLYPYNTIIQNLVLLHLISFFSLIVLLCVHFTWMALSVILCKYLIDLYYAYRLKTSFSVKVFVVWLMPWYQLYILPLILIGFFRKPKWKGRPIQIKK